MSKKAILIPVIALIIAAAVLAAVSSGLGGLRQANAQAELNEKMQTLLQGSTTFTEEPYAGENPNIRTAFKGETGYVIATETYGYVNNVAMLIGVSNDGKVTGLQVRDLTETPGLGNKALSDVDFLKQFLNTSGDLEVGTNIDAMTGATVTSKAIVRSVNSAVAYVTGADLTSSATTWGG